MLIYIGKIENSLLKAADFVSYAASLGVHAEIVTQGDYCYLCVGKGCLERLKLA